MLALGCDPDTHYPSIVVVDLKTSDIEIAWQGNVPRTTVNEAAMVEAIRQLMAEGFPIVSNKCPSLQVCVVEGQQVYGGSPVDPNDLIRVAAVGGAALAMCARCWPGTDILWPLPRQWTHGAPKKAHQARTMQKLSQKARDALEEKGIKGSHLIDAAGLALWSDSKSRSMRDRKQEIRDRAKKRARRRR